MRLRADAETSRIPTACATAGAAVELSTAAAANVEPTNHRPNIRHLRTSSRRCRKAVESRLKSVLLERRRDSLVVERSVGVDPVALWVDREGENFRDVGSLQQDLLARDQSGQELELHVIQLKQIRVPLGV